MSTTRHTTDRRADETLLLGLVAVLDDCASVWAGRSPHVSSVWAAAARALSDRFSLASGPSEAAMLLLDAAGEPLAPPVLLVDGLIALIVEQVATDAHPECVATVDRSLEGLRRLAGLIGPSVFVPIPR